jgi:hypothetical protein
VIPECRRTYDFPYRKQWPELLRQTDNTYLKAQVYDPQDSSNKSAIPSLLHMPYSAASLIEPGLSDTKISTWTSVNIHESRLKQLLEDYILHGYSYFHFFHKDLFLRDLKTGQTQFCSDLLVNAILAAASHYNTTTPVRNQPWNTASLCYSFFAEAKRLWEIEMGESKLTTLQAALVMNSVYNMDGLDQIGNIYMVQAAKMAYNMDLFSPSQPDNRTDMDVARQFTAWSFFSWQA